MVQTAPRRLAALSTRARSSNETMRLYPPAFVIPRAARERDEVVGVQIQPGDIIVVSPWVLHRHRRR